MNYIAMPLRPHERRLRRWSAREAFEGLLKAMAITPSGKWRGGDHFGLNDLLIGSLLRDRESEVRDARDEVQLAFDELGVQGIAVKRVLALPAQPGRSGRTFVFEMESANSELEVFRVELHE